MNAKEIMSFVIKHQVSFERLFVYLHCCMCMCVCEETIITYERHADDKVRASVKKRWHEANKTVKAIKATR